MRGLQQALKGLTTRGQSFLAAGIAVAVAALSLAQRDLLRIAVLLIALPLVCAWVVTRTRYRLTSQRALSSARVAAGHESLITLRLENVSRLPTGVLLVEDRVPYVLGSRPRFVLDRVEPRGRRDVVYPIRSEVRGRFELGPLSIRLTDPFGMCEMQRSFSARDTLMITPAIETLPLVHLSGDWAGSGESRARAVSSAGEDDAGTREYRQGDDLRRVHWRSTAKRGELMVRREEQPWQSRCTLLLDTRSTAHRGEGPASSFEWSVSATASIGIHLAQHGYQVRLLTDAGTDVASSISTAGSGGGDFQAALLDQLSVISTSRRETFGDAAAALRRTGGDGLLVAVLGEVEPDCAHQLARLRHGSSVAVAVLLDTATWTARSQMSYARTTAAYEGSVRLLRSAGWRVLEIAAGDRLAAAWPGAGRQSHQAGPVGRPAAPGHDRSHVAPPGGPIAAGRS